MRLPAQDIKVNEERKRRRRTVTGINNNLTNGCDVADESDEVTMAKQEKVANFSHHKRVADYLLGKSVGEGSFAKVRLGLHVHTAEEVAIKVMSKARARKDAYVHKNLRREGRILQMARHPNIVQVYDILETDNNYYLVTEFCRGGELIDIVTDKGCLPENDVRKYMSQLVSAVTHLHDHGIVHRDLKVENLLLDEHGDLKIIDFGLSNVISSSCGDASRALATQCGSPAYAAPELLAKNLYGPKVDVWSIGVITYALLVGKLPFTVEPFRIPKLCRKMLLGDMNPIPSHLSGNCRHFIRRLLVPDPDIRPTAHQVAKMTWINPTGKSSKTSAHGKIMQNKDDIYASSGDIDSDVVREMTSKLEFQFSDVLNCVRKNRPGEALATYYLLLKQKSQLKDTKDRHHKDVIGSDGNLDHGNETDKSSDEDEEGLNDIDDINDNVIFKDELYKNPRNLTNKKDQNGYSKIPFCNKTIVENLIVSNIDNHPKVSNDKIVSKTSNGRSSLKPKEDVETCRPHSKENGFIRNTTPLSSHRSSVRKSKVDIDKTLERLQNAQRKFDNDFDKEDTKQNGAVVSSVENEKKSSSKLPSLKTQPGGKSGKAERKSRGSMRDLMKTVTRAKEVLQRHNIFGQGKNNRVEDKKENGSPELNKFRRLLSRNGDDTTSQKAETKQQTPVKTKELTPNQAYRHDWKNYVPSATTPARIKVTETTPPATPLIMNRKTGSPVNSPLPSGGFYTSPRLSRPGAFYAGRPSLPSRIPSFCNRANIEGPDFINSYLPRISRDSTNDVVTNPLGYSNVSPRYTFPSPPRTPSSRETTVSGTGSGVKEIIDKFHSLMTNGEVSQCSPENTFEQSLPRPTDPKPVGGMSYLSAQRRKREEARTRTASVPNGKQVLRVQTNPTSTYERRFTSPPSKNDYVVKRNDSTFKTHFGREQETNYRENKSPYKSKKQTTPVQSPEYKTRGVWYKSAV